MKAFRWLLRHKTFGRYLAQEKCIIENFVIAIVSLNFKIALANGLSVPVALDKFILSIIYSSLFYFRIAIRPFENNFLLIVVRNRIKY